jgi:hypothetical protein
VFATVPVTFAEIVHVLAAATDPPLSESEELPATPVTVPLHVVARFGTAAIVMPLGSASASAIPESAIAPEAVLLIVTVSVDVPPDVIDVGENALLRLTGGATVKTALAGDALVAPCVVVSALAGIVFVYVPAADAVTFTAIVHVAFAPTLPPLSAADDAPATAVTVPPVHVVEADGVVAIVTPDGKLSVRPMPLSAAAPLAVFATVIVNVDVPPGAIEDGLKLFAIVGAGGAVSVTLPLAGFWLANPPIERLPVGIVLVTDPGAAVDDDVTGT